MFPVNWGKALLSPIFTCTILFAKWDRNHPLDIHDIYLDIHCPVSLKNSGIQVKWMRNSSQAAKTTAIELEAEEKGNGIEEDCLLKYLYTDSLLWRHQNAGNMMEYDCSLGDIPCFKDHVQISLFHVLFLAILWGQMSVNASESTYSRVNIDPHAGTRIISEVCKVHYTMKYSQVCFSWVCIRLNLLGMDEAEFLLTNQLGIGIILDNTYLSYLHCTCYPLVVQHGQLTREQISIQHLRFLPLQTFKQF